VKRKSRGALGAPRDFGPVIVYLAARIVDDFPLSIDDLDIDIGFAGFT
jgi:hypothetical protein